MKKDFSLILAVLALIVSVAACWNVYQTRKSIETLEKGQRYLSTPDRHNWTDKQLKQFSE